MARRERGKRCLPAQQLPFFRIFPKKIYSRSRLSIHSQERFVEALYFVHRSARRITHLLTRLLSAAAPHHRAPARRHLHTAAFSSRMSSRNSIATSSMRFESHSWTGLFS